MPYSRPYAGGFVDYPSTTTPINSTALNTMDVGIKTANDQFQTVTTAQRTALTPTVGQCVWDSDLRQLMVYMNASGGNAWQPIGNVIICASTTRPATPFAGQRIFETDSKRLWTYSGAAWIPDDMVFTTEAARDAAITAPTEGMIAYITAPTIPAVVPGASGTSYVPTGIQTIYNGSGWVCITEVGANTVASGTTTATSYATTLTGDATPVSVTLSTGPTAMVLMSGTFSAAGSTQAYMSVSVSGATTISAQDANALINGQNGVNISVGGPVLITGLTAGANTFTLNYRNLNAAITTTFVRRTLIVKSIA